MLITCAPLRTAQSIALASASTSITSSPIDDLGDEQLGRRRHSGDPGRVVDRRPRSARRRRCRALRGRLRQSRRRSSSRLRRSCPRAPGGSRRCPSRSPPPEPPAAQGERAGPRSRTRGRRRGATASRRAGRSARRRAGGAEPLDVGRAGQVAQAAALSAARRPARESARGSRRPGASARSRGQVGRRTRADRVARGIRTGRQERCRDDDECEPLHRSSICPDSPSAKPAEARRGLGTGRAPAARSCTRRSARSWPAPPSTSRFRRRAGARPSRPATGGSPPRTTVDVASARAVTTGATGTFSTGAGELPRGDAEACGRQQLHLDGQRRTRAGDLRPDARRLLRSTAPFDPGAFPVTVSCLP